MSIHTNPNKAVFSLLKHLAILEKKADLDDLKSELMKIKDLFSIVKRNEEELLDTLTTVYKYLRNSNIDKLMEEKEHIRERIQDSALLKLLPASLGETEAVESSRQTSQHPQKGEKLDASYQIHGLEDFMRRYHNLSNESQSFILFLFLLPKNLLLRIYPPGFHQWIALSFIKEELGFGDTSEHAGEVCRGIFINELLISESDDVYGKCMINPWIRNEWVKRLMLEENGKLYELYSQIIAPFSHKNSLRHNPCLALDKKKVKLGDELGFKSDHWRVIVNFGASYLNFRSKWMAKMKNLEMLHLGRWEDSASLHIESLEVLDLKACHNLETLPDISSLINLMYLNMSQCYLLESMPKGIEKLIKLEVLKGFVIGSSNKTHGRLASLAKLINLRKLSIHIRSDATFANMEFTGLQSLKLTNLKISWGTFKGYNNSHHFDGYDLPIDLQKLTLEGFAEENINPGWFTIASRAKELCIKGGKLKSMGDNSGYGVGYTFNAHIVCLKHLKHFKDDKKEIVRWFPYMQYVEIKEVQNHFNFNGSRSDYILLGSEE
ncbi:hypothetical protein RJT34_18563 [Clitoria ternatea]|uniref:Disease resistance R13L4/SHOC-2-like LRR domain-containing protein n=1 Tax=Clitoria ternatea TaxID=43366 RepID=A0AAN9PFZ3_CLITE